MKKRTLQFSALPELTEFSRRLTNGYIINTINLTLTAVLSEFQVNQACGMYQAEVVEQVKQRVAEEVM